MGSSAFHMDCIGHLIDSIWIPMDCQTDFQMDSNRFLVDFHLDSIGFNVEFQCISMDSLCSSQKYDGFQGLPLHITKWISKDVVLLFSVMHSIWFAHRFHGF